MKTNKSFSMSGLLVQAVFALLAIAVLFTGCKQEEPFDTQSPDDAPLILKPYNESGTGSFTYLLATPDTPLYDSVTVTPSRYTTVNWYLEDQLIFTGLKINMCFPVGKYTLMIEAVTEAGKRTERTGSVTVLPYATDPYAAAPDGGHHLVPGAEMSLSGVNLANVETILLTSDFNSQKVVCSVAPSAKDEATLTFTLPEVADGEYYLRLKDAEGKIYGSDKAQIHNASVVLDGYAGFVLGQEWVLTGAKLENVASVKVDDKVITELAVTATTITLVAPDVEEGEHTLSILNKDGSAVLFITDAGTVSQVTTTAKAAANVETTIWEGSCVINWGDANVNVNAATMANVPAGSTVFVYYNVPEAEYHALRIVVAPDWSADIVGQVDGMQDVPSPYSFTYTAEHKALAEAADKDGILITGFGLEVTKVTFK